MREECIQVTVFRYDPFKDTDPYYQTYTVPFERGMSAMNALDFIYQNIDSTLSYYDHAGCALGICARCTGRVNGKSSLLCQTALTGNTVIEPVNASRVLKDLVMKSSERRDSKSTRKSKTR